VKKTDSNKLKSNTDKRSINELMDRAHKRSSRVIAWKDVNGKRETVDVFIRTIRKSKNEFEIYSHSSLDEYAEVIVCGKTINLYIPDLAVLLQTKVNEREGEVFILDFPDMLALVERRSSLRLNLVESMKNEVRCFFYKSMSSKFLNTVVQTQYFERSCHDISSGGISFILPKQAEKFFQKNEEIPQIFLGVEGKEISVDARIVAKVPIEPTRENKLHYKGIKICLEFSQIADEDREVHVRDPGDDRYVKLLGFLNSEQVRSSHFIIFLGDIFDLMVGNHTEYIDLYSEFFEKLKSLNKEGKKISYFEGNHDLHLSGLFKTHFPFIDVFTSPFVYDFHGQKIHFSHGDNFDLKNHSYQRYKKILNSRFCKRLADGLVSYNFIKTIGEYSSRKSRQRNYIIDESRNTKLKKSYRENILQSVDETIDLVVFGHSHFVENELINSENKNFFLINNGFFPASNSFIHLTKDKKDLVSMD